MILFLYKANRFYLEWRKIELKKYYKNEDD
jgi:hypothetical protein